MFTFRNKKRIIIAILYILIIPSALFSQQYSLTLAALTDSADHYLPRVLEKRALVNSATADVADTRHQFLPSIRFNDQVNYGTDNSMAGSYFSYGIIPSTSSGIHPANDLRAASGNIAVLYGEYDLLDFGYKNARINTARAEETFQGADLQREIYILNGQISRAYFNLLISEAKLNIERQTVKRYDTIFRTIRALTLSGIKPGSDSSLAKAELSKSRITYNQINEEARNYRQEISYLTGISERNIITDTSLLSEAEIQKKTNIQGGASANPLLDYYENLKNVYAANEHLISKSFLPRVLLTGASWARGSGITYDDQYKSLPAGLGYQRFNYMAGLAFQYDLFNSIHKKDRLKSYGFQREASELELQQQTLSLINAARKAQNSIDITEQNLRELPVQYQAAADTYNQKMAQYKAGLITLIDLTNASFVLDRSMNDFAETTGNWYLAQLDKAIATGKLAAFIQSIR